MRLRILPIRIYCDKEKFQVLRIIGLSATIHHRRLFELNIYLYKWRITIWIEVE